MIRDKLHYNNRINRMSNNGKENSNIVRKLKRKIRMLGGQNG
jgi:hypothetical protein